MRLNTHSDIFQLRPAAFLPSRLPAVMSSESAPLTQQPPSYQNEEPTPGGVRVITHSVPAWKVGVLGIFGSVANVLMSTFCQCIVLAQIASRLGNVYGGYKGVLVGVFVFATLGNVFRLYAQHDWNIIETHGRPVDTFREAEATRFNIAAIFSALVIVTFVAWLRSRVRDFFRIPGSAAEDCCCSLFCHCCTVAQMSTQVEVYTPGQCSVGPRDTLPAYYVAVPLQ
ncbi:unnamed protein product [Aphanomyces euteiches]